MVALQAVDDITDPRKVIQRIHDDDGGRIHCLPSAVTRHFSNLFLNSNDPHTMDQLPSLDVHHPPESYTSGTLVRFCAMIQDTSLGSEIYLAKLDDNKCGGWGIPNTLDDYDLNSVSPDHLGTVSVFWAVSVPGEASWRIPQSDPSSFPTHQPSQPHKFPIPGAAHIGARVKIYDNIDAENLHPTDVVTFIGIASSEPLRIEDDFSPEVPVLHVLCYRVVSSAPAYTNVDPDVRADIIDWISSDALGGDDDAAEWLLLQMSSKVHSRSIPLLPPSLTISCFPKPNSVEVLPALSHVLAELLPQYLTIPLSLDLLNKTPFLPESEEEDLHSGYLQLPSGTTILLTESAIKEGKLLERGITNVRAIQDAMNYQTVDYIFPFSSRFTFHTNLSMIVLSEGRKSAFFQTSINLPLRCPPTAHNLYKSKNEVSLPTVDKMALYRSYIAACRTMNEKVQVTEEASKHIQDDFVRRRQQDDSMTQDELVHLLRVARLLAASLLQDEVTIDVWERAKELDCRRRAR